MKKELKFEDMSMTDFIRMAKKNGYEVQINEDVDRIRQLEKELSEKDKKIARLKADLKSQKLLTELYVVISGTRAEKKDYEKVIRHEICDEIRNKLKKCITPACGTYIVYYEAKNVEDVLDQIEGEK